VISEIDSNSLIKYLNNIDADLIKGDLITYDVWVNGGRINYMFDGQKIIDILKIYLHEFDNFSYPLFPENFRIIEEDVPIKYWGNKFESMGFSKYVIHFNNILIRDQCLNNLQCGIFDNNKYSIFTHFIYNGREYMVIFDNHKFSRENGQLLVRAEDVQLTIERCKQLLNKDKNDALYVNFYINEYAIKYDNEDI
jgi:hypothetical protein